MNCDNVLYSVILQCLKLGGDLVRGLNLSTFADNVCYEAVKLQEGVRAPPLIKSAGTGRGGGLLPRGLAGGELLQGSRGLSGR